jgi:hypothetical protein
MSSVDGDLLVFALVVGARLIIPLFIPRFPLPAILAALVIDAADQTIFQNRTDLDLTNYQGYDKALDIYYLTIAYLSTIRNWTDPFAFRVAQFLWYYRLVGVVLFELIEERWLLLVFPNTFEYFFIAYETVRLWWNPERLSRRQVIGMAAFIWIFIKLPQEWWIHVAMLDFTDFMKEDVLGVTVDTSWGEALSENLWFVALLVALVVLVVVIVKIVAAKTPPPDWSFTVDVDRTIIRTPRVGADERPPVVSWYMFEKIALVSMVTIIFQQVLPGDVLGIPGTVVTVGIIIVANSFASHWLAGRGVSWTTTARQFIAMFFVNLAIAIAVIAVLRRGDAEINEAALVFFVVLLTLIVTMFDRYHRSTATAISTASDTNEPAPV